MKVICTCGKQLPDKPPWGGPDSKFDKQVSHGICDECEKKEKGKASPKVAIVSSKEVGTNCMVPQRFAGGRCQRVMQCNYPEKQTCKAVEAEKEYLNNYYSRKIEELQTKYADSMSNLDSIC